MRAQRTRPGWRPPSGAARCNATSLHGGRCLAYVSNDGLCAAHIRKKHGLPRTGCGIHPRCGTEKRQPMSHGGARVGAEGGRAARAIVAPPYAIIPHPDRKGVWVVTHWCVAAVACPLVNCKSAAGELCISGYPPLGELGRYTASTHHVRRSLVSVHEVARRELAALANRRDVTFPTARAFLRELAKDSTDG